MVDFYGKKTTEALSLHQKPREFLKSQMMLYANGIFAEKLKAMGMVSYNDEGLSWYRVVNGTVLQSVYFNSHFLAPFLVDIYYGIHPLYIPAPIPYPFYQSASSVRESEVAHLLRYPHRVSRVIYEGTSINCFNTSNRGAEVLDEIVFPLFQWLQNEKDVYTYWNTVYSGIRGKMQTPGISFCYLDQVLYQNDVSQYEKCLQKYWDTYTRYLTYPDKARDVIKFISSMGPRLEAMRSGDRKSYLAILEERKRKFIKTLRSKLGIEI